MRSGRALAAVLLAAAAAAAAPVIPRVDGQAAMRLLRAQCDFGPRVPGTTAHAKTRDWLAAALRTHADEVRLQSFALRDGSRVVPMTNILARFGAAQRAGVLLCAHWDTRPFADRESDPERARQPILGANDGASGVAVLLEIARHLKAVPPPVPVAIALFDGEDWGKTEETMFLGSREYAREPWPWKPRYAILLDMVGDADLELPMEPFSWESAPEVVAAVWATAREAGVREFVPRFGVRIMDDHVILSRAGIPALDIIDFDYPYWHTLEDTPDKCSADSLRKVGDVVLRYLYTRERL
jgi:hypothetical protein